MLTAAPLSRFIRSSLAAPSEWGVRAGGAE
jgi:hypothetical protein